MPLYEYQCKKGHSFEQLRSMADSDKKAKCPKCGKPAPRAVSLTGTPILKAGVGGFHKPTKEHGKFL